MANLVESPANITDKRSARKAENRIAIVEAAESLILEGGYGALNAEALAERAGVSRRTKGTGSAQHTPLPRALTRLPAQRAAQQATEQAH